MPRLSIFGQPSGGKPEQPIDRTDPQRNTEPIYNKPFQRYRGRDEINRNVTGFRPRPMRPQPQNPAQTTIPTQVNQGPMTIAPPPNQSTTPVPSNQGAIPIVPPSDSPYPIQRPPMRPVPIQVGGGMPGNIMGGAPSQNFTGGMQGQPQFFGGGMRPNLLPQNAQQRFFTPSIYSNPFQQ